MSIEYIIVSPQTDSVYELEEMVNTKLQEGYELQGGASMTFIGGRNWIDARPMQAMIKRTKKGVKK